jgi:hypothetical protein
MFPLNFLALFPQLPRGNVIYGTFCLYSFSCISCGVVIYVTFEVCLVAYTTINNTLTIVGIVDGSTLPLIIFCARKFVLSYSLFTLELEAPPSSTLFFLLQTFLGEFVTTFFLFSSVVYISSLILLTFARGLCGFSF